MKKSKTAARVIGRVGRNPVIAVRVPAPLHHRITEMAKDSGRSMSEVMADLIARSFDWNAAFGDRVEMLKQAKAEMDRMVQGNFDIEMRRRGWTPRLGTPYWLPPGVAPQSGFIDPEPKAPDEIDEINAAIDALETRLNKLKADRPQQNKKEV
jgi:ribbon-helix-helix CopG family protein